MINGKKAILILGAIAAMNEIVIDAKKMGYYVIVTDYLENSPATIRHISKRVSSSIKNSAVLWGGNLSGIRRIFSILGSKKKTV